MPTTTTNFHVSATPIVLVLTTVARTFSRVAVVMTHVLKSVVVPTTARTFHVSAIRIVAAMATAARTLRRLAVVHALKSVVMLTTAMTFHVSATTIVKTMATAVSTTKQGVVEATKQHSNPFQVQLKAQVQQDVTHVRKSVVVPTATTFHVSATPIVVAMATAARTMRRLAVVVTHALKSVVVLTTTRTVGASATTFVKQKATAARTTKKVVVEATKQHLCEHCHVLKTFVEFVCGCGSGSHPPQKFVELL